MVVCRWFGCKSHLDFTPAQLEEHLKAHVFDESYTQNVADNKRVTIYTCKWQDCAQRSSSGWFSRTKKDKLDSHIVCHHNNRQFKCRFCSHTFTRSPARNKHEATYHPKEVNNELSVKMESNYNYGGSDDEENPPLDDDSLHGYLMTTGGSSSSSSSAYPPPSRKAIKHTSKGTKFRRLVAPSFVSGASSSSQTMPNEPGMIQSPLTSQSRAAQDTSFGTPLAVKFEPLEVHQNRLLPLNPCCGLASDACICDATSSNVHDSNAFRFKQSTSFENLYMTDSSESSGYSSPTDSFDQLPESAIEITEPFQPMQIYEHYPTPTETISSEFSRQDLCNSHFFMPFFSSFSSVLSSTSSSSVDSPSSCCSYSSPSPSYYHRSSTRLFEPGPCCFYD